MTFKVQFLKRPCTVRVCTLSCSVLFPPPPLRGRTVVISMSVHPSFHLSVHLSVRNRLSGAYLLSPMHNMPHTSFTYRDTVTLNHISRLKVRFIAVLYIKILVRDILPLVQFGSYSQSVDGQRMCSDLK